MTKSTTNCDSADAKFALSHRCLTFFVMCFVAERAISTTNPRVFAVQSKLLVRGVRHIAITLTNKHLSASYGRMIMGSILHDRSHETPVRKV